MATSGQELNSIKTRAKSATMHMPENDGSPVIRDNVCHAILCTKCEPGLQGRGTDKVQTHTWTQAPSGHHPAASTGAQLYEPPVDMPKVKTSDRAAQSVRP